MRNISFHFQKKDKEKVLRYRNPTYKLWKFDALSLAAIGISSYQYYTHMFLYALYQTILLYRAQRFRFRGSSLMTSARSDEMKLSFLLLADRASAVVTEFRVVNFKLNGPSNLIHFKFNRVNGKFSCNQFSQNTLWSRACNFQNADCVQGHH